MFFRIWFYFVFIMLINLYYDFHISVSIVIPCDYQRYIFRPIIIVLNCYYFMYLEVSNTWNKISHYITQRRVANVWSTLLYHVLSPSWKTACSAPLAEDWWCHITALSLPLSSLALSALFDWHYWIVFAILLYCSCAAADRSATSDQIG